jgi:hypothetical protein
MLTRMKMSPSTHTLRSYPQDLSTGTPVSRETRRRTLAHPVDRAVDDPYDIGVVSRETATVPESTGATHRLWIVAVTHVCRGPHRPRTTPSDTLAATNPDPFQQPRWSLTGPRLRRSPVGSVGVRRRPPTAVRRGSLIRLPATPVVVIPLIFTRARSAAESEPALRAASPLEKKIHTRDPYLAA